MARYYSDLDNGKTKHVDTVGTELANMKLIPDEAVRFLAAVFADARAGDGNRALVVSIRDDRNRVVYRSTLTLQGVWTDQGVISYVLPNVASAA